MDYKLIFILTLVFPAISVSAFEQQTVYDEGIKAWLSENGLFDIQKEQEKTSNSDNMYLFIERKVTEIGEIVKGTAPEYSIDFPTYDIHNSRLSTNELIEPDSETKALLGNRFSISGDLGGGISSYLTVINELPYVGDDISILDVEGDNATITIDRNNFTLTSGANWSQKRTEIRDFDTGTLLVTVTKEIINHGKVAVAVER
ncbi:MAG: hypothetical protein PHS80_08885 [Methanothrix sp.]|nr:hypothetical protein [Methanothrix sp.]MDD4448182.1 hypothetical protein [Methanothrix sp.]